MLEFDRFSVGYNDHAVVRHFSAAITPGLITALIGTNGSGKSTLLKGSFGLLRRMAGSILIDGVSMNVDTPMAAMAAGIRFVTQDSRVFPTLTVAENIAAGGLPLSQNVLNRRLLQFMGDFPMLQDKFSIPAGKLSGGEQQMVALVRALVAQPKFLFLDEPSLGLSPKWTGLVFQMIETMIRGSCTTVIIAEQKVREIMSIANEVIGLKQGCLHFKITKEAFINDQSYMRSLYL